MPPPCIYSQQARVEHLAEQDEARLLIVHLLAIVDEYRRRGRRLLSSQNEMTWSVQCPCGDRTNALAVTFTVPLQ